MTNPHGRYDYDHAKLERSFLRTPPLTQENSKQTKRSATLT